VAQLGRGAGRRGEEHPKRGFEVPHELGQLEEPVAVLVEKPERGGNLSGGGHTRAFTE
jgi:hypothetical protein